MSRKRKDVDINAVIGDYQDFMGVDDVAKKYHIGKKRVKLILADAGITLRTLSSPKAKYVVSDWREIKYPDVAGCHYVAVSKDGTYKTFDYMNHGGHLTSYVTKQYGITKPSLQFRRQYYRKTGNYWWEQWFDIILEANVSTKKCPYCDWETVDLENKSGAFQNHLLNVHNKTIDEYLKEYPEDKYYFPKFAEEKERELLLKKEENNVTCPICGKKFWRITESHVRAEHGMTLEEFRQEHPNTPVVSKSNYLQMLTAQTLGNMSVSKNRFISTYEREIQNFLKEKGVVFETNRQILIGREIDILVNDKKIGIDFDGLKWHTEWFGKKSHRYHLEKTEMCNQKGYGLIHIFEDEYVNHKKLVLNKISHILGIADDLPRIPARKCTIQEIYKKEAEEFLEKNHIQGYYKSSIYLGAFYDNKLVAVMSFKNGNIKNPSWELTRFASDDDYILQGVGGKLFKYFINTYHPQQITSFADRRWTIDISENLYTKLGFVLERKCPPDYKYYNERVARYKRFHKMAFTKASLHKKYGFPLTMTETEMVKELGYDRIWDCGLLKYVWRASNER